MYPGINHPLTTADDDVDDDNDVGAADDDVTGHYASCQPPSQPSRDLKFVKRYRHLTRQSFSPTLLYSTLYWLTRFYFHSTLHTRDDCPSNRPTERPTNCSAARLPAFLPARQRDTRVLYKMYYYFSLMATTRWGKFTFFRSDSHDGDKIQCKTTCMP